VKFGLSLLAWTLASALFAAPAQAADSGLRAFVANSDRSPANRARDEFRHPEASLSFFGVKPDSVVVEILPGSSGYWTEILAPFLRARGRYIAAIGDPRSTSAEAQRDIAAFNARFVAAPDQYGAIETTWFKGDEYPIAAPGAADFVLTFRNIHNWMAAGDAPAAFAAFFKALKPGGVLGVEGTPRAIRPAAGPARQERLCARGFCRRSRGGRRLQAPGGVRDQRQSQRHQGLSRRRLGPAAELPA